MLDLQEMDTKIVKTQGIGSRVTAAYVAYGKELNSERALPHLLDGLKPSYRRTIYASMEFKNDITKSAEIVASTMGKYHAHGQASVYGVLCKMVRNKIFSDTANFGYYPIYGPHDNPAADRYTRTRILPNWYDLISKLIGYVPYRVSDANSKYKEPIYLPSPIPLILIMGGEGIGMGISGNYPNFSAESIYDAYKQNNPLLLKPNYDIELDYEESDLEGLWTKGWGKVTYKYRVYKGISEDNSYGVYVEGDPIIFKPNFDQIISWQNQGLVFLRDSYINGTPRTFVGINKGIRKVTQDMIYEWLINNSSTRQVVKPNRQGHRLAVYDGTISRYIPMKEWLDETFGNYYRMIANYKEYNTNQTKLQIEIFTWLPKVAQELMDNKKITNEEICTKFNISEEVVTEIMKKSISALRKADTSSKIKSLKESLKYFEDLDADELVRTNLKSI